MKLTSNPDRIEAAHNLLQHLEDELVGYMSPTNAASVEACERVYNTRLDKLYEKIWQVFVS